MIDMIHWVPCAPHNPRLFTICLNLLPRGDVNLIKTESAGIFRYYTDQTDT